MPPSGNGNRGNGNPFKRNSPSDPNGNQKGNNSGGPQPFWKSPWLWGVLLVVMAVAGFQLFAGAGTQTIDTKDGFALLKTENVAYAKIIDNKQLVQLELKSNFTEDRSGHEQAAQLRQEGAVLLHVRAGRAGRAGGARRPTPPRGGPLTCSRPAWSAT